MTLHITIQVVADDRGDAIRLVRDAAQRLKQGKNEGEWQHCMGAYRIGVVDDDIDRQQSRFADNDPDPVCTCQVARFEDPPCDVHGPK